MRVTATMLVTAWALVGASGCSFIDDFGSFTVAPGDASVTDLGRGGDAGDVDGGIPCPPPSVTCGGACVDLRSSSAHCGRCENACPSRQACVSSACIPDPVVRLGAGSSHACAVHQSGALHCWGLNYYGELGTGDLVNHDAPQLVQGLPEGVVDVACGESHTCAIGMSGAVYCWGANPSGELGTGVLSELETAPMQVAGITDATEIAAGYGVSCALGSTSGVSCWGTNSYGTLARATVDLAESASPVQIVLPGGATADSLAVGQYDEFVCVSAGDAVYCWGSNANDEIGSAATDSPMPTPTLLTTPVALHGLQAGGSHVCGTTDTGAPYCWGLGDYGELGRTIATPSDPTPQPVMAPPSTVASIGAGRDHSCWVSAEGANQGAVYCAGSNTFGQIGIGGMSGMFFAVPQRTLLVGQAVEVVSADLYSCARLSAMDDNAVYCWGRNESGENATGDSETVLRHLAPTLVPGL